MGSGIVRPEKVLWSISIVPSSLLRLSEHLSAPPPPISEDLILVNCIRAPWYATRAPRRSIMAAQL
ncbi:hypothetical protein B0H12DRAFT_1114026 [Mycena haematopus]|nr:hypothetical protein B0H12DRAFT_1114026 [Mycena haematopus]